MWGCGIPFFCQLPTAKHSKGEKKKQASRSSRPPTEKPPNTAESLTAKIISLIDMTPSTYESEIKKAGAAMWS